MMANILDYLMNVARWMVIEMKEPSQWVPNKIYYKKDELGNCLEDLMYGFSRKIDQTFLGR